MMSKVKRRSTHHIQFIQKRKSHISNSQILLHRSIEFLLKTSKKIMLNKGVYMDKELNSLIGGEVKSQMLDSRNDIQVI